MIWNLLQNSKLAKDGFGGFVTGMLLGSCHYRNKSCRLSENEVAPFKKDLQQVMEENQITLEQLYNCDETGLYYRSLPTKTLAAQSEKQASGMKKQKECVTLMGCNIATGTYKFPLMFVGKAANPRCFKHVNKKALPIVYYSQRNAWVDCKIFTDWFYQQFVPDVKSINKIKAY